MCFHSIGGCVTLLGLCLCISGVESMRTLKNVAVKRGGSVTIPCLYKAQYKASRKFWCDGYFWSSCGVVAYADSNGSTALTDHPAQNLFTVELNPVFTSGTRWCAAEIPGNLYDRDYLHLTVSQDPDLSVTESRVSGEEGGNVTVQCLYSAGYQNAQKVWCRLSDGWCSAVGTTTRYPDPVVQISDDGRRSFSVRMSGLKKSDAGWYWCGAGGLQHPVHLSVSGTAPVSPKNETEDNKIREVLRDDTLLILCIIAGLLLLLVLGGLVTWRIKRKQIRLVATNKGYGPTLAPSASESQVIYNSVRIAQRPAAPPVPSNDSVIYSTVKVPE